MKAIQDAFQLQSLQENKKVDLDEDLIFIKFILGKDSFGVPIEHTSEIVEDLKTTAFPQKVKGFESILNLRGNLIPIIESNFISSSDQKSYSDTPKIIIFDIDGDQFGIKVDRVKKVMIPRSEVYKSGGGLNAVIMVDQLPMKLCDGDKIRLAIKEHNLGIRSK